MTIAIGVIGILAGVAFMLSFVAIGLGLWATIQAEALKRSTHTMLTDMAPMGGFSDLDAERVMTQGEMPINLTFEDDDR